MLARWWELGDRVGRLIWVVGSEAQDDVAHWPHHEGVASHRNRGECFIGDVLACIFVRANGGLKRVAVEVKRMSARVIVVENDLNNGIVFEDVGIRVDAVDGGVVGEFTSGEGSVES